ncbi:MAG: hypothetical protein R3F02_04990 [Thiolinea sp.]
MDILLKTVIIASLAGFLTACSPGDDGSATTEQTTDAASSEASQAADTMEEKSEEMQEETEAMEEKSEEMQEGTENTEEKK